MRKLIVTVLLALVFLFAPQVCYAKIAVPTSTPIASPTPIPTEAPRVDITQKSVEVVGPLEKLIYEQKVDNVWPGNFIKQAIRNSVHAGVPANTIVLLLLLPIVATVIAATRQIVGIRGFGIFLPAALSVTFVAIGPILGIALFIAIVTISTLVRIITRKLKLKMQYLPKMALILWFVSFGVLGILFTTPYFNFQGLKSVSIFPVLVLTLLVEDFTRIQLGKSVKTALGLTSQTLILSLLSYAFLTLSAVQKYVLLNPEMALGVTFLVDIILGRYIGLRFMEYYRFRKLIRSK